MKKYFNLIYIIAVFCMFLVLASGIFAGKGTMENEQSSPKAQLTKSNSLNMDFLDNLDDYVTANIGFRSQIINMNSIINQNIFHTSSVDSVVLGDNGYLYYSDTVNDYLGITTLNEREQYNVVHTLELMQEYVNSKNADFIFTIAPNKNSLYDYMPYNYVKVSNEGNADVISKELDNVNYVDLFSLFNENSEELYCKLDSHWNNKGAYLAFEKMIQLLSKDTGKYAFTDAELRKDFSGDLYKMIRPLGKQKDWNYYYNTAFEYHYITKTRSVEQSYIETENPAQNGSLLMFRDSFGNALLPFFANTYGKAVFDKNSPYDLRKMETYDADTVIIEIAERNLALIQQNMPVFYAPERSEDIENNSNNTIISSDINSIIKNSDDALVQTISIDNKDNYICITGNIKAGQYNKEAKLYLKTSNCIYELTPQKINDNEYGFCGYLNAITDISDARIILINN